MKNIGDIFNDFLFPREIENNLNNDDLIKNSNSIFKNPGFKVELENQDDPRFEAFHGKHIVYLPKRFYKNKFLHELYDVAIDKLGEDRFQRFVAYHEFGHAAQVARITNNQMVDIKGNTHGDLDLNYMFNGASVPNKVNNFLVELFKEGFADCYAGLCLYKETGDLDVFKKISEIRSKRYPQLKKENKKTDPQYFIHRNFNVRAAEYLGEVVAKVQDVFSIPFIAPGAGKGVSLEKYIERAVIRGCLDAVLRELKTNDACLNHFRGFARDFKLDTYTLTQLLGAQPNAGQIINYEKTQGISSYFLELAYRLPKGYHTIITPTDILTIVNDSKYQRSVDPNLQLMDVVDIPYTAGLEGVRERIGELRSQHQNISSQKTSRP